MSLDMLEKSTGLFDDELCWPMMKERVKNAIFLMNGETASQSITDEFEAARFVLEVIANTAERKLCSGEEHIYRGALSTSGKSFKNIAEIATHKLHEYNSIDDEELERRLARIELGVASAG